MKIFYIKTKNILLAWDKILQDMHHNNLVIQTIPQQFHFDQILAKRGTASKFKAEANLKVLVPNLKRSWILIYKIRAHTNAEECRRYTWWELP